MEDEFRLQKAERFLAAAASALDAGHWESCASRAYYAVYHLVVALMLIRHSQIGKRPRTPVSKWKHTQVRNEFLALFCNRGFFFNGKDGTDYGDLLITREDADYHDARFDQQRAERALQRAERLAGKMRDALERNVK